MAATELPAKLVRQVVESIGYRFIREVGRGTFAVTAEAVDASGNRRAVKVLDPTRSRPERVQREIQALKSVSHTNVVRFHNAYVRRLRPSGRPLYAFEFDYVDGRTLFRVLREAHIIPTAQLLPIARQIVEGLGAIWARNLVHRDLSLGNIMVDQDGTVTLLDLGVARHLDLPSITASGQPMGTPLYMSPEQYHGDRTVDFRSDMFSLGVILYQCLTGAHPYSSGGRPDYNRHPERPSSLEVTVPPAIDDLILRLLQRDALDRFSSYEDLDNELAWVEERLRRDPWHPYPSGQLYVHVGAGPGGIGWAVDLARARTINGLILSMNRAWPPEHDAVAGQNIMVDPLTATSQLPSHHGNEEVSAAGEEDAPHAYVRQCLTEQMALGPRALVAPYLPWASDDLSSTEASIELAAVARQIAEEQGWNTPVFAGVVVGPRELTEGRPSLLRTLTRARLEGLFIVANLGEDDFSGPRDPASLVGLIQLVNTLRLRRFPIILANRGVEAIGMFSLGLHAIGTQYSQSGRNRPLVPRSGGRAPQRRRFVPKLLSFVLQNELSTLRRWDEVLACDCPLCGGQIPENVTNEEEKQHYVANLRRMAHTILALSTQQGLAWYITELDHAMRRAEVIQRELPERSIVAIHHLEAWRSAYGQVMRLFPM